MKGLQFFNVEQKFLLFFFIISRVNFTDLVGKYILKYVFRVCLLYLVIFIVLLNEHYSPNCMICLSAFSRNLFNYSTVVYQNASLISWQTFSFVPQVKTRKLRETIVFPV